VLAVLVEGRVQPAVGQAKGSGRFAQRGVPFQDPGLEPGVESVVGDPVVRRQIVDDVPARRAANLWRRQRVQQVIAGMQLACRDPLQAFRPVDEHFVVGRQGQGVAVPERDGDDPLRSGIDEQLAHRPGQQAIGGEGHDLRAAVFHCVFDQRLDWHEGTVGQRDILAGGHAQRAGVEFLDPVIGQVGQALVAAVISLTGYGQPFLQRLRIGVDRHLHLVHDRAEVGVEARVQNLAEVLHVEALVGGGLGDADPGDVALADVLDARRAVDEVVDLPLQNRLEVLLHLPSGDLHHDAHVHVALLFDVVEGGADDLDPAVDHLVEVDHTQVLEAAGVLAAELDAHIRPAHDFALEGRTIGYWHGHVGHLDLDAAHLDALLHQALGALQIVLALDLVEGHADHVLIGGHAGGQNLRDDGVGDDGEAEVDRARRRRVLEIVHLAQRQHKGEDAILVVEQDVTRLAALHAAEGQGRAHGEAQGVDGADRVRAEGHGVGVVAQLYPLFDQLVDDAPPVDIAGEEAEDVATL